MAKHHHVKLNKETFSARSGQVLLDAAMIAGVDIPHDCRAGRCGTCVTNVKQGITLGGETLQSGVVHACQARVFSDLSLLLEPLPPVKRIEAQVSRIVDLTEQVVELKLLPAEPLDILPGQYCRFTFRGFPARPFSPTAPLDGGPCEGKISLNIKRVKNGSVSARLGSDIKSGHRVTIEGPFGHAFLRPNQTNRLVLFGTGTGFAPVWAVCDAALKENPDREILILTGARSVNSLYMWPALDIASRFKNVAVVATTEQAHPQYPHLRTGHPLEHLPKLRRDDIVYAAGSPEMVTTLGKRAQQADALFYSDPFEAAASESEDWITRAVSWLRTG